MSCLTDGLYNYTAYAIDEAGRLNITFIRNVTTQSDFSPPDLWFTSPSSNGSTTSNNWIYVNVSASENLNTCLLNWYNGTWTNVSMAVTEQYCYVNMTGLNPSSYYFRTTPYFETSSEDYSWLNRICAIATGSRVGDRRGFDVYQVL